MSNVKRNPKGYWDEFRAAIDAMKPRELLIWTMPEIDTHTARCRRTEMHTGEFKTVANWFEGQYFIVRVK